MAAQEGMRAAVQLPPAPSYAAAPMPAAAPTPDAGSEESPEKMAPQVLKKIAEMVRSYG